MNDHVILWRRLDAPGHESSRCFFKNSLWHLVGTSVFAYDGNPCRLDYTVICNASWKTLSGGVHGWVGNRMVAVEISVGAARRWRKNGAERPSVMGCTDIDLNFSPSTNLIPIRRLNLSPGQEARVQAAWLRFPGFRLEPLEQCYRRLDEKTYRYESAGGDFFTEIEVNTAGFVTQYPNYFQVESEI